MRLMGRLSPGDFAELWEGGKPSPQVVKVLEESPWADSFKYLFKIYPDS